MPVADGLAERGEFELTGDFVRGCRRQYRAICQAAITFRSYGLTALALNGAAACDKGTGVVMCGTGDRRPQRRRH